jgi:hypothetical protein
VQTVDLNIVCLNPDLAITATNHGYSRMRRMNADLIRGIREYPWFISPHLLCFDLALGIPPNHGYIVEQYPFYATKDGKGRPVLDRLAYIAI